MLNIIKFEYKILHISTRMTKSKVSNWKTISTGGGITLKKIFCYIGDM
jgi:hypothetical protein